MRYKYPVSTYRTLSTAFDWRDRDLGWPVATEVGRGLEGVIATTTEVMWLDPSSGSLAYRGRPVEALASGSTFEDVAFLLITGSMPDQDRDAHAQFCEQLRSSRALPADVISLIRDLDPSTHPTRQLRAGVSALGCHELTVDDDLSGERHWREPRIVGQVAAVVAEVAAHRAGRDSPTLSRDAQFGQFRPDRSHRTSSPIQRTSNCWIFCGFSTPPTASMRRPSPRWWWPPVWPTPISTWWPVSPRCGDRGRAGQPSGCSNNSRCWHDPSNADDLVRRTPRFRHARGRLRPPNVSNAGSPGGDSSPRTRGARETPRSNPRSSPPPAPSSWPPPLGWPREASLSTSTSTPLRSSLSSAPRRPSAHASLPSGERRGWWRWYARPWTPSAWFDP